MNVALGLLAVVFLVLLNGFFVATEFALVKVRPTRIDELARKGSPLARQARKLVQHLDEYLSATQLGITVASLGLGWIGEPVFARVLDPLVRKFGLGDATVETVGAAVAFVAITFLHIVFGELAPKSIAIQRAEATSLYLAGRRPSHRPSHRPPPFAARRAARAVREEAASVISQPAPKAMPFTAAIHL